MCECLAPFQDWFEVTDLLQHTLHHRITIYLFDEQKGILYNLPTLSAEAILFLEFVFIRISKWRPECNRLPIVCDLDDCWVCLEVLPFHFWNPESLSLIGDALGGLVKISQAISNLTDLTKARIKIACSN